jgi:linoleoyl-CoA desaturase
MSTQTVKFNTKDRPEFFRELHKRVNSYFKDNQLSKHADANMKIKTLFMILLYAVPLILMLTKVVTGLWPTMLMWTLMGFGMSGIGLSIMHDANHRSYSSNQKVNAALGYILNFIGGYHVNWIIQHNVLHHSYTNVDGHDEDIETPILRCSPHQDRKTLHRFQAFYAPVFYGLMTFYWLVAKDFVQIVRYHKMGLLPAQGKTYGGALAEIFFNKTWYVALTLVLPMFIIDIPWWQTLLGFLGMQYIAGLILAFIFQPAHVIEETDFFKTDDNGSVENNWAIHQLLTTANYANASRGFSWFIGGLNFQIEHHLFPGICHVHYRNLSPIVKELAQEYGIPYYEHKSFMGALGSHFSLLHQLGTGKYDKNLAVA